MYAVNKAIKWIMSQVTIKDLFAAHISPPFLSYLSSSVCLDEPTEPEEPVKNSLDVFPNFRAVIP